MKQMVVNGKTYDVFVADCGEAIAIGDPIARKVISEFPRLRLTDRWHPVYTKVDDDEIEFARFVIEKMTEVRKAA